MSEQNQRRIRTRIRLNRKAPDLEMFAQKVLRKEKVKDHGPFPTAGDHILRLHHTMGNDSVQRMIASGEIRTKLTIGKPNDRYEQEADRAADRVMAAGMFGSQSQATDTGDRSRATWNTTPLVQTQAASEPAGAKEEEEENISDEEEREEIQTKSLIRRQEEEGAGAGETAPANLENKLKSNKNGGTPLMVETQSMMESRFGANFSDVKVHDDAAAHEMNRTLQAQAFTHQNHIYFGAGYYNPDTPEGQHLLAHELAHVLQQGAAGRKKEPQKQSDSETESVQRASWGSLGGLLSNLGSIIRGGFSAAKRFFRDKLRNIPGYSLLGVVMGRDPLTGESIERNGRNFIEAGLDVIPNGADYKRKLEEEGALQEAADWLDKEIAKLNFSPSEIADKFWEFWDDLGITDVFSPGDVIQRLKNIFVPPIERLFTFARNVALKLLEIVKDFLISKVIEFIKEHTTAYPLLTVILGKDPISEEEVERTPMNLLKGFMELSEDGAEQIRQMEETGSLQRAADWLGKSYARLLTNLKNIRNGFIRIWKNVGIGSLLDPVGTFKEIYDTFAGPVGDILSFLLEVAIMILKYIKDALLSRLAEYARTVRGFPLLTVILGKDPFTGEKVPRTARNFVRGFLSLLEDGEERYRNLNESGALDRAFEWLGNEVRKLNLTWDAMVALFTEAWESFSLSDLSNPLAAFKRIVNLFKAPVGRIIRFAAAVGLKILEFVFEGVMGAGGARVLEILKKGRDTFLTIIRDPIAFLGHLVDSVKLGFRQFSDNIWTHLKAGLVGWLFGALEGAGLQLPEKFDLRGIISLVLQILGLTYDRIRPRLVKLLGEDVVARLESTFEFLKKLVTEGPSAAWEKIVEFAGNLRDMVFDGIKNFVVTRIVQSAVIQIAAMFNPAGAVIQAILTIYNTIMFFIERINQILAVVESLIESVANIAAGQIAAAANYVEKTMARTIPVIISFLARLMKLGNISEHIKKVIERIREPIDRAIDKVVDWIAAQARKLKKGKGEDKAEEDAAAEAEGEVPTEGNIDIPFDMKGHSHTLTFELTNKLTVIMSSNNPDALSGKLQQAITTLTPKLSEDPSVKERIDWLGRLKPKAIEVEAYLHKAATGGITRQERALMARKGRSIVTSLHKYGEKFDVDDIAGIFEKYPAPKVGLYDSIKSGEGPLFDGSTREAHHAPPNELANSMKSALLSTAQSFDRDVETLDDDFYDDFYGIFPQDELEAYRDPIGRGARILAGAYRGIDWTEPLKIAGNKIEAAKGNLSAILIHPQTHTKKGAGDRIHGTEIREPLQKVLVANNIDPRKAIVTKTGSKLAVKATGTTYEEYLKNITAEVTGWSKKKYQDALLLYAPEIIKTAYKRAAVQTLGQVDLALKDSKVDGSKNERNTAMSDLRNLAKKVWEDDLLKSLL